MNPPFGGLRVHSPFFVLSAYSVFPVYSRTKHQRFAWDRFPRVATVFAWDRFPRVAMARYSIVVTTWKLFNELGARLFVCVASRFRSVVCTLLA